MSTKTDNIICPTCGKSSTWTTDNKFRPFCSDRCKLTDLGEWADESRRIPGESSNINPVIDLDDLDNKNN